MSFVWLTSSASFPAVVQFGTNHVRQAHSAEECVRILASGQITAVVLEVAADSDQEKHFSSLESLGRLVPVWVLDAKATVSATVGWLKAGATEVFSDIEELIKAMDSAGYEERYETATPDPLVGRSRSMRAVKENIELIADRRCNVLIEGETGTGKEVVARQIHGKGGRSRGPWVAVNCSAIPEALLEAELFGHVKGAFTGAVHSRVGKFEAANRGTIFLDEIGDMPIATQAKLLRVLQEREVERLGGNDRVRLDVRVIAATNVNLADHVKQGRFRQDLYYRLNVFRMELPALRTRLEDVPPLVRHFVQKVCQSERLPLKSLDPSALDRICQHDWPGNVRELENCIETAVLISGSRPVIFAADLRIDETIKAESPVAPQRFTLPAGGLDYQRAVEEFEHSLLAQALARARGNKTAAADLLGLKRTTLSARMRVLESRFPRLVA